MFKIPLEANHVIHSKKGREYEKLPIFREGCFTKKNRNCAISLLLWIGLNVPHLKHSIIRLFFKHSLVVLAFVRLQEF